MLEPLGDAAIVGVGALFGCWGSQLTWTSAGQQSSKYSTTTVCSPAAIGWCTVIVLTSPSLAQSLTSGVSGSPALESRCSARPVGTATVEERKAR